MPAAKITHAVVRMYRLGTGDCFVVKFFAKEKESFKLMIDAGSWIAKKTDLDPKIEGLLEYVDHHVDLLVVTHEHKDHVAAFDACKDLFCEGSKTFRADQIWMGWTEDEGDPKVDEWKEEYGTVRKALHAAHNELTEAVKAAAKRATRTGQDDAHDMLLHYSERVGDLLSLAADDPANYAGALKGMAVVKNDIAGGRYRCLKPGQVLENLKGAPGVRFFVLGPPEIYKEVAQEAGGAGESYDHNKVLKRNSGFATAALSLSQGTPIEAPFDRAAWIAESDPGQNDPFREYLSDEEEWRRIDYDWLVSTGGLALRMDSLTNNLSLALAIEFEDSGRVMLFPGDAEFGSWASWHRIPWSEEPRKEGLHFTHDLLTRTVFYKVAHHLSHNGTARALGLEMMEHKDLAAMATLDYGNISSGWKSTMPNRAILAELLRKTKGRLMIMNADGLFMDFDGEVPLQQEIENARKQMGPAERKRFNEAFDESNPHYIEYTVRA